MRRTLSVTAAVVLAMVTVGCGLQGSETNEVGLIFSGGTFEEKEFKGFLKPGSTNSSVGVGSKVYRYRTDQRSYIGSDEDPRKQDDKAELPDRGEVQFVTKDGVRVSAPFQLYFKLNRDGEDTAGKDCDKSVMCRFHRNLGVKTKAWELDGWRNMLRQYFEPQILRSMEGAGLGFEMRPLRSTEEARVAFQTDVVRRVKEAVKEVIGEDYFCGPRYTGPGSECGEFTFTVGKPEPINEDIVKAIEAEQTARAATIAQEQRNAQISKELEVERELVKLYGAQGALLREAIKSGKVQQFIVDETGRSTTNAPAPRP